MTKTAVMRPRARLISLLGEELISDEPVAVVELVKNSYDADASKVTVEFTGENPLDPDTLIISDDGVGMSVDTVLGSWLEPGSVHKRLQTRSARNRAMLGAKGIGRFASARLASSLLMETTQKDIGTITAILDWGRFDDSSYLDEISVDYEESAAKGPSGTKLTLQSLHARRHWTLSDFESLHNRLARLISPFEGDLQHTDFKIELVIPGSEGLSGQVRPHGITEKPRYRLTGDLTAKGEFSGSIEVDGIVAENYCARKVLPGLPLCGGFSVEIRAWDRDHGGLSPFAAHYGISVTQLRKILDDYCGVTIYRDGFRVYPYGEKGNDWLSLDTRSRQNPTMRLANNQIIGAIRLSRDGNPLLLDRSNREGLILNFQYAALIEWFTAIISLLEEKRYNARPREENAPDVAQTIFEVFDLSDISQEAKKSLGPASPLSKLLVQRESDIRVGVGKLQEHYSRVMMAAGFGQLVDLVIHEIGSPLGKLGRELNSLERTLRKDRSINETVEQHILSCRTWVESIAALREKLLPRAAGQRGKSQQFDVREEIVSAPRCLMWVGSAPERADQ